MKVKYSAIVSFAGLLIIVLGLYLIFPWNYTRVRKFNATNIKYTSECRYYLDKIDVEKRKIEIAGWILKPLSSSTNQQVEVIIMGNDLKNSYRIKTFPVFRLDLNAVFQSDKTDYSKSGFKTSIKLKNINKEALKDYKVVLKYINKDEELYINTEQNLL